MTLRELINSVDSEQYSDSALYQKLRETKPEYGAHRIKSENNEKMPPIVTGDYQRQMMSERVYLIVIQTASPLSLASTIFCLRR